MYVLTDADMNVSFLKLLLNIYFPAHCDITSYNTEHTTYRIDSDFRCSVPLF